MKSKIFAAAVLFAGVVSALANLNVSSDGSDGAFAPSATNTVVDLSLATAGTWNQNNAANSGNGVYDPDKRAIIFKYSSVNIAAGRTVSFKNHPSRAAVVWLIRDDISIAGSLGLSGSGVGGTISFQEPGPGGFRGGPNQWFSAGLGIGGGIGSYYGNSAAGQFSTVYGNPSCIPLIGGSGAGGQWSQNGAGGGGAILIAAGGTITVTGGISANSLGSGSSGAIRLVADSITGTGSISASVGGRIRIEANTVTGTFFSNPQTSPVFPSVPVTLWPSEDNRFPVVKIVSIDGASAPLYATGAPMDVQADVDTTKAANAASTVILRTQRFSISGTVKLRAASKYSSTPILISATFQSGDVNEALWSATVTLPEGYTCLQAIATYTP